jgi:hypothetical protein
MEYWLEAAPPTEIGVAELMPVIATIADVIVAEWATFDWSTSVKASGVVQAESVLESIKKVLGESKAKLIPINREAMQRGEALV